MKNKTSKKAKALKSPHFWILSFVVLFLLAFFLFPEFFSSATSYDSKGARSEKNKGTSKIGNILDSIQGVVSPDIQPLDIEDYDKRMNILANNPPPKGPTTKIVKDPKTGMQTTVTVPAPTPPLNIWPAKTVYPNAGALLPFNRIIAYYGNLYSKGMGVLGEYPEDVMLAKLAVETKKWQDADPATPVIPALHYIAVTAQGSPGESGKYRLRMPDAEIDKVLKMADKIHAIVFLDIQVGFSTLEEELPRLNKYFKLPNVHLGIDPEFSMKTGIRPGKVVGTFDASDINYAANFLAKIVKENNLTPKILVVHRYTEKMVTNYRLIRPLPEVQIVMHMDGWGGQAKKKNTYEQFVYKQPVQFSGFKIFYKNDILDKGTVLFAPSQLMNLRPIPSYIQYQ